MLADCVDRWRGRVALLAGCTGFAACLLVLGASPGAAQPVDGVTYSEVREIRERLMLMNRDLGAIGCSEPCAETVLRTLLAWYRATRPRLEIADEAVRRAEKALRETTQKIHMGPRDEALIARVPELRKAREDALKAKDELVLSAIPTIESVMPPAPRDAWRTLRSNPVSPEEFFPYEYRFIPDLKPDQKEGLIEARKVYSLRARAVKGAEERSALDEELQKALKVVLTPAQIKAVETARANLFSCTPGAVRAESRVLPMPGTPPPG